MDSSISQHQSIIMCLSTIGGEKYKVIEEALRKSIKIGLNK